MSASNPDKAEYLVRKYTGAAFHGAFLHLAGDKIIENTLPRLRYGASLMSDDLPSDPSFYMGVAVPDPHTEPYHTFLGASVHWWIGAERQLFQGIDQTPSHPYKPLQNEDLLTKVLDGEETMFVV